MNRSVFEIARLTSRSTTTLTSRSLATFSQKSACSIKPSPLSKCAPNLGMTLNRSMTISGQPDSLVCPPPPRVSPLFGCDLSQFRGLSTSPAVSSSSSSDKPSSQTSSTGSLAGAILAQRTETKDQKTGDGKGGGGGGDEKEKNWFQRNKYPLSALGFTVWLGSLAAFFSMPDKDENGNVIPDEFSSLPFPSQHYRRVKSLFFRTKKDLEEPFSDKLLPEPLEEPYHQPKYTILIELSGLLVHSSWTHKYGWRFQKRPGVDMFLTQIGYPNFELVVFTNENAGSVFSVVDGLDPNNMYIMYRLFRDATRYVDGHQAKDLSVLNRDLKRVIMVDWDKDSASMNRENALILPKWEGDNTDRSLIGLAQLLQAIRASDVDDVREVLAYYKQFEDPIETFRENQRKLQTEMEAAEERKKEQSKKSSFLSGLSGFGRSRT